MKIILNIIKRFLMLFKKQQKNNSKEKSEIIKYPNDLGFWKNSNKKDDTL